MSGLTLRLVSSAISLLFVAGVAANQAPVLQPDSATVEEGGNVIIDVLANDVVSDGSFDLGSMYISTEATNGYLGIDSNGRVSYTHYGGPTTADTFSYVISGDNGVSGRPAIVSISIGNDVRSANDNRAAASRVSPGVQPPAGSSRSTLSNDSEPELIPTAVVVDGPVTAFHRSGQTFLTWRETTTEDRYHVYRHTRPITAANLRSAQRLTSKWGPLDSNTSVNVHGGDYVPSHFVINDLADPLSDDTGLFVYTTQPGDSTSAYYAVASVRNGRERSLLSMANPVSERVAIAEDVLTVKTNGGSGRVYTQFMDYLNWNPTLNGYAYNYAVALPVNYSKKKKYPLMVELHAYYEQHKFAPQAQYGWQVIQLFPSDPGPVVNARHSWWYGYSNSHDYRLADAKPRSGSIENFTEQRVLRAIDQLKNTVSVDPNRIYGSGNSMGASGLLAMAIRYGTVFTGVYANQPMTNYAASQRFSDEFVQLWGAKSRNLPVTNRGPHTDSIREVRIGVWDWMNHQQQLVDRRGSEMGFLMTLHGKQDDVIEWQTQGRPFVRALTDAVTGFTAIYDEVGHSWVGFASAIESLFGFGYEADFPYKYPLNMSYPAISNASGSAEMTPADTGKNTYNMDIEWATPHTPFAAAIVDTQGRFEVSVRSTTGRQTADVTPRRTRRFKPQPGQQCRYQALDNDAGSTLARGTVTADRDALVTVKSLPIVGDIGTRLTINCR
jgi:hypothetical protein